MESNERERDALIKELAQIAAHYEKRSKRGIVDRARHRDIARGVRLAMQVIIQHTEPEPAEWDQLVGR